MDGISDLLLRVLGDVSTAAAIIDQDRRLLCVNGPFEERFPVDRGPLNRCELMQGLNLTVHAGGRIFSPQETTPPGGGGACTLYVYMIDKTQEGDSRFLVMARPENPTTQRGASPPDAILRDGKGEDRGETEALSSEFRELIGEDVHFRRALFIAQKAAKSDLPVLILGESGTGKEILARAIHRTSRRCHKALVDVNCAAIPDTLIESELFGYEKGAFTGARTEGRSGYFDVAHEGTILLDEIGDASLKSQSKLLRVLEDGCFKRVGGNRNVLVDVRLISSTNQDLKALIAEKAFREDLYYRLNTFTLQLPPLRDRAKDIPLLVDHFLMSSANHEHRKLKFLPSAMEVLQAYHWPGNVRELKGVVNYAVNMSSSSLIAAGSLPNFLFSNALSSQKADMIKAGELNAFPSGRVSEVLRDVEKDLIKEALEKSANKSEAIKKLGISRRTFYLKLKQYGFR